MINWKETFKLRAQVGHSDRVYVGDYVDKHLGGVGPRYANLRNLK